MNVLSKVNPRISAQRNIFIRRATERAILNYYVMHSMTEANSNVTEYASGRTERPTQMLAYADEEFKSNLSAVHLHSAGVVHGRLLR